MKNYFFFFFCLLWTVAGCSYTLRSTEGNKISTPQIQEIKIGKTTEVDLLKLLGSPSRRERQPGGIEVDLYYIHSQIKSLTLPGGVVLSGFFEKEEEEIFKVNLKNGIVQSYLFVNP